MRTRILIASLVSTFVFLTSCNKEKTDDFTPEITQDDVSYSAKSDAAVDDASAIILEQFSVDAFPSRLAQTDKAAPAPTCATITRVPAIGTPLVDGDKVTKTIDYGTTGCVLPNGNTLKGKIIISFYYHPKATSHEITYTFENFYHNEIKLDGTRTITIKVEPNNVNPTHLAFYINLNVTVTLPNGKILKITGNKKREIVEGEATPDISDNVYAVTGSWETVFPNGATRTATITSALNIKMSCASREIVKGIITFVKNDKTATLDFGNGACDNKAILTINGISYDIYLRK
ncbi:hypothetical protein [Flavobacterium sp.]|uniref:hypothetical protein n=1 Tax=Flavobacterium sp. TaxID=239 RepID=UPI003D0B3C17